MNILELRNVSKKYEDTYVLKSIDLNVKKGSIHALVGENGAGKSTLIKIISGVVQAEKGAQIYFEGDRVEKLSITEMLSKGITVMYQDINVFNNLSVAENICMNDKLFGLEHRVLIEKKAKDILRFLGGDGIIVNEKCGNLSVAQKQIVSIARALYFGSKLIIMDEPTSALTEKEVKLLHNLLNKIRGKISVIYISHKLEEIYQIADEVTVLRDGYKVVTKEIDKIPYTELINCMIGRDLQRVVKENNKSCGNKVFEIKKFTNKQEYQSISFCAKQGEILGITGVLGSGRTELAKGIVGINKKEKGEVFYGGELYNIRTIRDAINLGICYLPEDRKKYGLFYNKSVMQNISVADLDKILSHKFLSRTKEVGLARKCIERIKVKTENERTIVERLSGGNQQKVLFAKWMHLTPKVLIIDEPTSGVDIGAKNEIYKLLRALSDDGVIVIVISSDIEEILMVADRILVMRKGNLVKEIQNGNIKQSELEKIVLGF